MYEILGLKHMFFTFQETVWSCLNTFKFTSLAWPTFLFVVLMSNDHD